MLGWWSENPCVPEYINRLEDAPKKAARANLPITNDWLAAIATMSLLAAGSFPKLRLDWDGLASSDKTWPVWKSWALKASKTEQRAFGNRCDVFGSASSAIATHGTLTAAFHPTNLTPSNNQLPTLSKLESHLDNMAMAVTNKKSVLDSLVASNATLTKLTSDKLSKLEKLVLDLKPSAHRPAQSIQPPPASTNSRSLFQLRAAIKHTWVPGGFCSTHGWGVSAGHSSTDCKGKQPGHVDSATHTNPKGPGASKNKGWDDFLTIWQHGTSADKNNSLLIITPCHSPLLPPLPSTATPHCLHTQPPDRAPPWSTVPGSYMAPQPPTSSLSLYLSSNSNPYRCLAVPASPPRGSAAQTSDTAILDSGASNIYFAPDVPVTNVNPMAPTSTVTNAAGAQHHSSAHVDHLLPTLPACSGKIMPSFKHTLFGVRPLCDNGCRVLFDSASVTIYDKTNNSVLLKGVTPSVLSATDLPSVGALVHYLHAAAGFPVKSTWSAAIKAGNYTSWPGLTYANAARHCPDSTKTIKGHLPQTRKGIRSTKPKSTHPLPTSPPTPSHELHVVIESVSKLSTDDMGRFPTCSRSGNQYIMLAYHCNSNTILVEPFHSRHDRHHIAAHGRIMTRLRNRGHLVEHQILDNKASKDYHDAITQEWKATYQLVPPNVHRANAA
eukprot:CCRYP_003680-RA/>CCRYP_003680-RA protein AED:0.63 eAED:0.34 QI:0/0/0/1/1/1/2/0/664